MLSRLIYSSEPSRALDDQQVTAILTTARQNNERNDITGMLVFDSTAFLQVIEGDREKLSKLYAALVRDPRHHHLTILGMGPIDEREFSSWQMGFAAAHAGHRALFLKHSASSRFEPQRMTAHSALSLLKDLVPVAG
jgi:hypothetical protein